jgi:hypothetical protein
MEWALETLAISFVAIAAAWFVAFGLFCFGQGTGLLLWPHNAAMIDYGAGIIALGIGLAWAAWR